MPKPDAVTRFNVLMGELAAESLRSRQSKQQWYDTLREIRDELDVHIEAAKKDVDDA